MSVLVLILAALAILLGYGWYARNIDRNIIQPDPKKATPAKMFMDGVDFTPTSRNVLFGYQFKSIAALGPIVGPIVAVQYGWLPALLWVLLGTFFIGWVQDYSSIIIGVRNEGQTFGALSYRLISPRARVILLIFIYCYLWLIMGAFGKIVGYDLLTKPSVPLGVLIVFLMGLLFGQMLYRWKLDIILTTVIAVVVSFVGIWLGTLPAVQNFFNAINGPKEQIIFGSVNRAQFIWSLVTVAICYAGAVLPIWRFAQPTNYVAFWIVVLGVLAGIIGLLVWHPGFGDFPAFRTAYIEGLGPIWPILFVTIACGAISGWHSLVSSSGTARQLEKEVDALPVGGGAMFLEMTFATVALLTATAAYGNYAGYKEQLGKGAGSVFAVGLATFMNKIGVPMAFGVTYGAVFLCLMAFTIMYLVVRFMRVAWSELLGDAVPAFRNVHISTLIACLLSLLLIWTGLWQRIWVLFGGANQLMASLALLLITIWLISVGKNYTWTFVPFVFMYVTTIAALLWTAYRVLSQLAGKPTTVVIGNVIAGILGIILVAAALFLGYDALQAVRKAREAAASE